MRHCPRCTFLLTPLTNGRVEIDHCTRCRGSFFDAGEAATAFGPRADPQSWVGTGAARAKGPMGLRCPADGAPLVAYAVGPPQQAVEVDVCHTCRGVWFDAHEGSRIAQLMQHAPPHLLRAPVAPGYAAAPNAGGPHRLPSTAPPPASAVPADDVPKPGWPSYLFQLCTGLPMEVSHPTRRRPWVIISLVALLIGIFVAQVFALSSGAVNEALFAEQWAMMPAVVLEGRNLHTLLTHAFLHGGILHLLGNLYFLYVFGDNIETDLGAGRFTAFYLLAAVLAGLAQALLGGDPNIPVVGASGAISALMGAYLVFYPKVKLWWVIFFMRFRVPAMVWIGLWAGFNIVSVIEGVGGVAWWAHLGGFGVGVAAGYALRGSVQAKYARAPVLPAGPGG